LYVVEKTDLKNRPLPFMDRGQKNSFHGMTGLWAFAVMLSKNSLCYTTTFPYQIIVELLKVTYLVKSSFFATCLSSGSGSIR
jgi:hypothetical protein